MIKSEYLADQKGSGKFGTCASCGKDSHEDQRMIRLMFRNDRSTQGVQICLCDECRKLLYYTV